MTGSIGIRGSRLEGETGNGKGLYRLGGNLSFRRLLRAIGSNCFICSAVGPGIGKEEDGSTSSESSVAPV